MNTSYFVAAKIPRDMGAILYSCLRKSPLTVPSELDQDVAQDLMQA